MLYGSTFKGRYSFLNGQQQFKCDNQDFPEKQNNGSFYFFLLGLDDDPHTKVSKAFDPHCILGSKQ